MCTCSGAQQTWFGPWSVQPNCTSLRASGSPQKNISGVCFPPVGAEPFMDNFMLLFEDPACVAVWENGAHERSSVLTRQHCLLRILQIWTRNTICVIFCEKATARLCKGNCKHYSITNTAFIIFFFPLNFWRAPLVTSCCDSSRRQRASCSHQMGLVCAATRSRQRQQMEWSPRQCFAAWSWCLMNYRDKIRRESASSFSLWVCA